MTNRYLKVIPSFPENTLSLYKVLIRTLPLSGYTPLSDVWPVPNTIQTRSVSSGYLFSPSFIGDTEGFTVASDLLHYHSHMLHTPEVLYLDFNKYLS